MKKLSDKLDDLDKLIADNQSVELRAVLQDAHPADIAVALERLTPQVRLDVWCYIPEANSGKVLAELSDGVFTDIAANIDSKELIASIKELDVDDIADLVPNLPEDSIADILFAVDKERRNTLGEVLSYPEDSAGGLMDVDATVVRDDISLKVLLRFLRLKTELPSHTDSIYLQNTEHQLTGIVPINRLITAPINDPAKLHLLEQPVSFKVTDSEEDVAKAFADYNLISAPVVDDNDKLVGRITIDDVVDVIREQAEEDFMAAAGLKNEADIFAPVIKTSRNRTVWLGINLLTALLGSWVIGIFEGTIQQLVALAVLMPVVASMGGNAGTQTLTVVIRGMSTGTITSHNIRNVLKKEFFVSIVNALLWALIIAVIAALWFKSPELGMVIAVAMAINLVMGAIAGVCLPTLMEKFNIDPALAGGVALTTVTDVIGYFSVLGLATLFLL